MNSSSRNRHTTNLQLASLFTCLALAPSCAVQDTKGSDIPQDIRDAFINGKTTVRARYRFEEVSDDGTRGGNDITDAHASTLRTTVGFETARVNNIRGRIGFENVASVGDAKYNSTVNGQDERAVVADPVGTELEEAWLAWDGMEDLEVKLGRQEIVLADARFVGNVGWRQNHQTFDAVRADWTTPSETKLFAAYVHNVNRIFGDNSPVGNSSSNTLLLQADHGFMPELNVRAYGFLIDSEEDLLLTSSTNTFGARVDGKIKAGEDIDALYTAEFAVQSDAADNPNNVDAEYFLAELGASMPMATVRVSYEQLGGSGDPGDAFQTPLATLHAFNGWADQFLSTPDGGLVDLFVTVNGKAGEYGWKVVWHDFSADSGGADYGTELNAALSRPINDWITCGLNAALFDSDEFSDDVTKLWAWVSLAP